MLQRFINWLRGLTDTIEEDEQLKEEFRLFYGHRRNQIFLVLFLIIFLIFALVIASVNHS